MHVYGWSLIGGFVSAGMLLGAGIGLGLSRLTNR
jgi:hypothetical protein